MFALCATPLAAADFEVTLPLPSGTSWQNAVSGLADGDTLVINLTGSLTGFQMNDWSSPELAGITVNDNNSNGLAVNLINATFNFSSQATFCCNSNTRFVMGNGFHVNPGGALTITKTGNGILQINEVQTCRIRLVVNEGYVSISGDSALGPPPATLEADSITLAGGTLENGFNNTSYGTAVLAPTRGITLSSGSTSTLCAIFQSNSARSDFIVLGPITGGGDLYLASASSRAHMLLAGPCTYSGNTTFRGWAGLAPGGSLPPQTVLHSNGSSSDSFFFLGGGTCAVAALDNNSFTAVGPGLLDVADHTLFPKPKCQDGAAVAVSSAEAESADSASCSYAIVENGSATLLPGCDFAACVRGTTYELRIYRAFGSTNGVLQTVALSEIVLMKDGVPLDQSRYDLSSARATSTVASWPASNLVDLNGSTFWKSAVAPQQGCAVSVFVTLNDAACDVNGYALGAGDSNDCSTNPTDWDLFAIAPGGPVLLDSRRNVQMIPVPAESGFRHFSGNLTKPYAFNQTPAFSGPVSAGPTLAIPATAAYSVLPGDSQELGAVSGSGTLALGEYATLAADLSGWSGTVVADGCARLNLSATSRAGATQPQQSGITYAADSSSVALLLDDVSSANPLRGRLSGAIGLVKRGSSVRRLWTESSDNTGTVSVEEGTLIVEDGRRQAAPVFSVRYFRFCPTCVYGGPRYNDGVGYNWSINDIQLLDAAGERIAWPSGTTAKTEDGSSYAAAIDGKDNTRSIIKNIAGAASGYLPCLTIVAPSSVSFSSYRWYTAMNTTSASYDSDARRTPVSWELQVSDDGTSWRTADVGEQAASEYTNAWASSSGFLRGPYGFSMLVRRGSEFPAIPDEFVAASQNGRATVLQARYLRFMPFATSGQMSGQNFGCAFSELDLYLGGERVAWTAGASCSASIRSGYMYQGTGANLIDNVWNASNKRFYTMAFPGMATVDAGEGGSFVFDAYGFHNDTANGARRPTGWKLWLSNDGTDWFEADARVNETASQSTASSEAGRWSVAGLHALADVPTYDVVGDAAPVSISSSATLSLDCAREAFGPLSGAGTLSLVDGAQAVVNTVAGTTNTFSGSVAGAGTLSVCGPGAMAFSNAGLGGVTNLAVEAATVIGSASFSGSDVTVSFADGGSILGTFSGIGALTVSGPVVLDVPANIGERYSTDLFTFSSMDAASRAALLAMTPSRALPSGYTLSVSVSDTACHVAICPSGLNIIIR